MSDRGDEKELKARHQEYINLYNAECVSSYPRTPQELLKVVHGREKARRLSGWESDFISFDVWRVVVFVPACVAALSPCETELLCHVDEALGSRGLH